MNPGRYPVFLDLSGRRCLVVGGGRVATRKARELAACGARVVVVAPEASAELAGAAGEGAVVWHRRGFREADLEGTVLAFAAASDPVVNRRVVEAGRRLGAWVNAADDPAAGDFHVPAVVRRGALAVAVSTGGASPTLAAWVRDRVADALPEELGELVELARQVRQNAPPGALRRLLEDGILEDLGRKDRTAVRRKLDAAMDPARCRGGEGP